MGEPLAYVKCCTQDVRKMCDTAVKLIQFQRRRYRRRMIRKCWNDAKVAYFKWSGFLSCWLIKPPTRRTAMKRYHAGRVSPATVVASYFSELEAEYATLGVIAANDDSNALWIRASLVGTYYMLLEYGAQTKT